MFKSILLPVDLNNVDSAKKAKDAALSLLTTTIGGKLHVLNVVPDTGMAIVGVSMNRNQVQLALDQARMELNTWVHDHIASDIDTQLYVTQGTVYDEIIKLAAKVDVDAILLAAQRVRFDKYLLIGSNAVRVVRHAKQSVFVIR